MQIPIAYALNYPKRLQNNIEKLDLFDVCELKFEKPDLCKFPCLRLAYEAIAKGHSVQVALNAANEVLVAAFLSGEIKYTDIPKGIEKILAVCETRKMSAVKEILDFDGKIKTETRELINSRKI